MEILVYLKRTRQEKQKVQERMAALQEKLRLLNERETELENTEIVRAVRALNFSPSEQKRNPRTPTVCYRALMVCPSYGRLRQWEIDSPSQAYTHAGSLPLSLPVYSRLQTHATTLLQRDSEATGCRWRLLSRRFQADPAPGDCPAGTDAEASAGDYRG